MYLFKVAILIVLQILLISCAGEASTFNFESSQLTIASNGDKSSHKAADYLYDHLKKRILNSTAFQVKRSDQINDQGTSTVYLELVPDLDSDYEIRNEPDRLSVFGREYATLCWISYLLIDHLSNFQQLDVADLPPNYLNFKSHKGHFSMQYREPHLPSNLDADYAGILLTKATDRDWGIWGHNLKRVFGNGIPTNSYAFVDGKRINEQYCFSAQETYNAIKSYIRDQYGDGTKGPTHFMIAPNDNDLVCTCMECQKKGNTKTSATAAVGDLLNRLAQEFPKHHFFTLAYRSTAKAPKNMLMENVGVFVSTIDLPKNAVLDLNSVAVTTFSMLANNWKTKVRHLYGWDYISNFDDYLTPFPAMERVKKQLPFFNSLGIDGLFLNGSGYDYSSFEDVKTYVFAALMIDPSLDVPQLITNYLQRFYPRTGNLLSSYLIGLEHSALKRNQSTDVYSSFRKASRTYIDQEEFLHFYRKLIQLSKFTMGNEREKIDKLLTGLAYTKLQIQYARAGIMQGDMKRTPNLETNIENKQEALDRLSTYMTYADLKNYKEEDGAIHRYIQDWKALGEIFLKRNDFIQKQTSGLISKQNYEESYLLSDGLDGFASDFNQGWFLAGEDIAVDGIIHNQSEQRRRFALRCLVHAKHRMLVPDLVELFCNGQKVETYTANDFELQSGVGVLEREVELEKNGTVQLRIYKSKDIKKSVIACDEIRIY
jgi:hypothetical protein